MEKTVAYIALGSNIGNRQENIRKAIKLIEASPHISVTKVSSLRETQPQGGPPQRNYINGTAEIQTSFSPAELLECLQNVERQLGRERTVRWGPRTIDLDILLYGNEVIREPNLEIPHPRMHLRRFVIEPLEEIAPGAWHPVEKRRIDQMNRRKG